MRTVDEIMSSYEERKRLQEQKLRETYQQEPWGKIATVLGFDPVHLESVAREVLRRVAEKYVLPRPVVQHVARGTHYDVVGRGKIQSDAPLSDMDSVVVYVSRDDGSIWARRESEFLDGRFVSVPGGSMLPPEKTPWTPPENAGEGYVCLGLIGERWVEVRRLLDNEGEMTWWAWSDHFGEHCVASNPREFAPLPKVKR